MLDLYIQITVALLLAFLLGFLSAKMWVHNRQNEYLAKSTQSESKFETEKKLKQLQINKVDLLQNQEQMLTRSVDKITLIKTSLEKEVTTLNKNLEEKKLEIVEAIDSKYKIKKDLDIKSAKNNELTLIRTSLEKEVTTLNKNLEERQLEVVKTIGSKEKIQKALEIKLDQNNELTVTLQLATEEQHFLNSQITKLSENHQNTLKTIGFMEEQASTFIIQQDQLQKISQQSTQQYESMDEKINRLNINEKEALKKFNKIEKEYLDLKTENESIKEETVDYCDKLSIANKKQTELEAHTLVRNHTFGAISVAIIPIPFVDLATLLGIQVKMLHALAEKYQIPFSKNKVKSLIFPLLSSTLTMTGAIVFSSFIKIIPGIGQASGMVSISVLSGTMTYATGEIFIEHFESGGTFLDFDAKKQKGRFRELYEKGKQVLVNPESEVT